MALAAASNSDDVSAHIVNGYKRQNPSTSHRGLNQYTELVNTAMASKMKIYLIVSWMTYLVC